MTAQASTAGTLAPLQPIIVRDGRGFDLGSKARSLAWPYPSVTAGCLRSLAGRQGRGADALAALKALNVRGPFPWDGRVLYFPAPVDVQPATDASGRRFHRLVPPEAAFGDAASTGSEWMRWIGRWFDRRSDDTRAARDPRPATLATPQIAHLDKVSAGPAWWSSADYERWQLPDGERDIAIGESPPFAHGFPTATRTHAKIDASSGRSEHVFQTAGLDFSPARPQTEPIGIAVDVRGDPACIEALAQPTMTTLGGERRAAWWERSGAVQSALAMQQINLRLNAWWKGRRGRRRLRAVLVTPAYFRTGWWPDWIDADSHSGTLPHADLPLTLVAAASRRWTGVSGWDMETHSPKPMRRLVPAGSVFYFETDATSIDFNKISLTSICSDEASRRDGFGLVLWGVD
ncbi:MAG TPA: type III-B CRISPR module-associated Cmr3 family protein [Tahibacter sp.]|nr:type III-B CRISPR module-associated Cmr3 family protein [Tahibacter sp.]